MTTTTASPSHTTQRQIAAVGAGTGLVAAAWTAYGADDWIEIALVAAGIAVTTALVFALVVPRALRGAERGGGVGGTALALSVPAVLLTLPAFWSGLPLILGVAGAWVGAAGRRSERGSTASIVALALGLLAVVAYLAIYIGDGLLAGNAGFLFD